MNSEKDLYQDIRPYNDSEISGAISRLICDEEFVSAIINHRFSSRPGWVKTLLAPFVKMYLKTKWGKLETVYDVQLEVEKYLNRALKTTTDGVSFEGLENLDSSIPYLFISNHRDIAMDPALINYGLHHSKHKTVRIAIGDNLLKKSCTTELMKLNKSFIVKRSAKAPRELMKALGQLSSYIKHSLDTGNSIWIAQREGRAKDGNDVTEPAILKMFYVEGRKKKISFSEYMKLLNIVPVAISYENDPCDLDKAKELDAKSSNGSYQKSEFEDIKSIIKGLVEHKGRISVRFGRVINKEFDSPDDLAIEIDRQIRALYKLYPVNLYAAGVDDDSITEKVKQDFIQKLDQLPESGKQILKNMYANPVHNKN